MPEPLNYSNTRSNDLLNRLTQSATHLKLPHSPTSCKSNSISIDENANIEDRTKSPFGERRASSVGAVTHHQSNTRQSVSDIKRIDKIAETLRTVNKNYFEQLSNANNKAPCTMIPHSPPVSLSQMKQQQPAFPQNFAGHFLSEEIGIRRTSENIMFEPQMTMSENFGGAAEMMMDKPALPKPTNQKLYATCFICNKKLSNQYNLRVHLETHQNMR